MLMKEIPMIERLEKEIFPLKQQLINHPLYQQMQSVADLRHFTEMHVYAVWDFMSLVKKLQLQLTTTSIPWVPSPYPEAGRLINEIVWGEETDLNQSQQAMSHFKMYLQAMEALGADTVTIKEHIKHWAETPDILEAINATELPDAVKAFLVFTFSTIATHQPHVIAAVFTFGREDLIPDMFIEIIKGIKEAPKGSLAPLIYYFERHIEVDGDQHGPMALRMIQELCGADPQKWEAAISASKEALQKRIDLWDAIHAQIANPVFN